ncbi:MAG: PRC-barrel domain-containing protein [Clostridia bacterium]|nr:PRC-barrel domain-containing protein [Clostridia bacterium]
MGLERYSEVLGLPVICIDNGKKLGMIQDVIFCPKQKRVEGFILERKGCQVGKRVVLLKDVFQLGKDAMVLNECSCIKDLKKAEAANEVEEKGNVLGLRIYSRDGNDLGVVKDVLFDYKTGAIEGVEVSDGLIHDLIEGRNILPLFGKVEFGEENILVDKEAIEEIITNIGGLKNRMKGK